MNKVYYDKKKDELWIKLLPWFEWILVDANAPEPLEKRYNIPCVNKCRLLKAKIVDDALINRVLMEGIRDVDRKEKRYFELLREWKGFIMVRVDITVEFNQFQERIRNEYIEFHRNREMSNKIALSDDTILIDNEKEQENTSDNEQPINHLDHDWDNRKYFLNNDEMPYLKWNKRYDRITRDVHILLERKLMHNFHVKLNCFEIVEQDGKRVLGNIFEFTHVIGDAFRLVCKTWNRIANNY